MFYQENTKKRPQKPLPSIPRRLASPFLNWKQSTHTLFALRSSILLYMLRHGCRSFPVSPPLCITRSPKPSFCVHNTPRGTAVSALACVGINPRRNKSWAVCFLSFTFPLPIPPPSRPLPKRHANIRMQVLLAEHGQWIRGCKCAIPKSEKNKRVGSAACLCTEADRNPVPACLPFPCPIFLRRERLLTLLSSAPVLQLRAGPPG